MPRALTKIEIKDLGLTEMEASVYDAIRTTKGISSADLASAVPGTRGGKNPRRTVVLILNRLDEKLRKHEVGFVVNKTGKRGPGGMLFSLVKA